MNSFLDLNMEFLRMIEDFRTPFLNTLMSAVTKMGEETFCLIIGLLIFWCISKKVGYLILLVNFSGIALNQILKLAFHIPRPWILDPNLSIVESAKEAATGYSFPSGHSQFAVGMYGSIAASLSAGNIIHRTAKCVCIAMAVLVCISRLYLGVHTPFDVIVSVILATAFVIIFSHFLNKKSYSSHSILIFCGIMVLLTLANLIYAISMLGSGLYDLEGNLKNAATFLGASLAIPLSFAIEQKYIKFDPSAKWWLQIIKAIVGLSIVMISKKLLGVICTFLFPFSPALASGTKYFLLVFVALAVCPAIFVVLEKVFKLKKGKI